MKLTKSATPVMASLIKAFNKGKLFTKRNSPEIALTVGIVGIVGTIVLACRATIKAQEVSELAADRLDRIDKALENPSRPNYTEEIKKNDTIITYVQAGIGYAKCYAPAIALGAISIASILYSHRILSSRNAALATAYAALETGYKKYRKRVAEKIGEEAENDLYHNVKKIKDEVSETDQNGKTTKKKVDKKVVKDLDYSPYARFFDEANKNWDPNPQYNLDFLRMIEEQMTNRLRSQGHLFLNEVYDALSMERSTLGQTFGWVYDPDSDISDNFVDFNIYDANRPTKRNFVNGYENVIIIEPNVDGNIITRVFGRDSK